MNYLPFDKILSLLQTKQYDICSYAMIGWCGIFTFIPFFYNVISTYMASYEDE